MNNRRDDYGFMTIDGRKVEFTDEKNVLLLSFEKAGIRLHFAIILSCMAFAHVCRLYRKRMTEDVPLLPVQRSPETAW